MITAASVADWLRAGGIGVGVWAVFAVLTKAATDASNTKPSPPATVPAPQHPAPTVPPRPTCPPSTGRHAAGPAQTTTSQARVPHRARHSEGPAWN